MHGVAGSRPRNFQRFLTELRRRPSVLVPRSSVGADTPREAPEALTNAFDELAILASVRSAHEACEIAAYVLARLLPARRIDVALYDIDADALRFVARAGAESATPRAPLGLYGEGLVAECARRPGTAFVALADHPRYVCERDSAGVAQARTTLIAAAALGGRLRTLVQIVDPTRRAEFTDGDRAVADDVAQQLAEAVVRAS